MTKPRPNPNMIEDAAPEWSAADFQNAKRLNWTFKPR